MRFVKFWTLAALAWAAAAGLAPGRAEAAYTQIVAFGDSLSDTGNVFLATGSPSAPYFQGRYSDGPVWVETLANRLGLTAPTPSLAGGTNYAWGGAESGTGPSTLGTPNLRTQVATYLAANTPNAGQLFTVWAGANDFVNAGVTDPQPVVGNVAAAIASLANAGARNFLVLNLPLLGTVPKAQALPQAQRDGLNQLSAGYNLLLAASAAQLESSLGVSVRLIDVAGLVGAARSNPAAFGFTNTTGSALGDGRTTGDGYLFWDDIHPTSAAHRIIGDVAFSVVPEPSAAALMATACAALAVPVLRSRRRPS